MFYCLHRANSFVNKICIVLFSFSWSQANEQGLIPPKVCGYVKENATVDVKSKDENEFNSKTEEELKVLSSEQNRTKRQAPEFLTILRQTRCPLLLVADYRYSNKPENSGL